LGPIDFLWHLAGFLAPAAGVALLLSLSARLLMPNSKTRSWLACAAIDFVAGVVALGLGLWLFGRDGKMLAYAALVVASASSQWISGRGWR
jgi:hypothetical protein